MKAIIIFARVVFALSALACAFLLASIGAELVSMAAYIGSGIAAAFAYHIARPLFPKRKATSNVL